MRFSGEGFRGDLMIFFGTILWSLYTVFSKDFLDRISPLKFAAVTVFFGALTYLPFSVGAIVRIPWSRVSAASWAGLAFSSVFSLVLGYLIWYTSVRRVGNARTAVYSNLTPLFTALFAYLFLGESLGLRKIIGGDRDPGRSLPGAVRLLLFHQVPAGCRITAFRRTISLARSKAEQVHATSGS